MGGGSDRIAIIKEYFARVDAGSPHVLALFDDRVEFFFPKFGRGRGKDDLIAMWTGLGSAIEVIRHDADGYHYFVSGDVVTVEGTTSGRYRSGAEWSAGETPGGRFCNVFEFDGLLIRGLRVYLDPDYTGEDAGRFLWGRQDRNW